MRLTIPVAVLYSFVAANPLLTPSSAKGSLARRQNRPSTYAAHTFDQQIDHFPDNPRYEPHANSTFKQR